MRNQTDNWHDNELEQFALKLGGMLKETEQTPLPSDISARLALARSQALTRAVFSKKTQESDASPLMPKFAQRFTWWQRLLAALPIAAAGAGAAFMQGAVSDDGLTEAINNDIQILSNEVPPQAYNDPGFIEFLKNYKDPADQAGTESAQAN